MENELTPQDLQDEIALKIFDEDESAIEDILTHYAPPLIKWLTSVYDKLTTEEVEGVVSDAIGKFWDHRNSYDDKKASIRTLLQKIAENTAKDVLKKGWHKAKQMEHSAEQDFLDNCLCEVRHLNQAPSNEQNRPENEKAHAALLEILSELPDIQRETLMAYAKSDGDLKSSELGKRLGNIPAGTVRVNKLRGERALREGMKKRGFDVQ